MVLSRDLHSSNHWVHLLLHCFRTSPEGPPPWCPQLCVLSQQLQCKCSGAPLRALPSLKLRTHGLQGASTTTPRNLPAPTALKLHRENFSRPSFLASTALPQSIFPLLPFNSLRLQETKLQTDALKPHRELPGPYSVALHTVSSPLGVLLSPSFLCFPSQLSHQTPKIPSPWPL